MTRNEHTREALDSWRINLAENWEILFWTQQLDCTEEELRAAIDRAGPIAGLVRAELRAASRKA